MNLIDKMYNRKGFIHHPDTLAEDKAFYARYREKSQKLLKIGNDFINNKGVLSCRSLPREREELCTNSRHLHRGFYCPSPTLDILIGNSKRGKILIRPSNRSHITNRYVYDKSNRLIYVDNYIDDKMVSSEYLIYQDNVIYGVTIGISGRLTNVSEEVYDKGVLKEYICAYFAENLSQTTCYQMDCEVYSCDLSNCFDWDYYQLFFSWENIAPSGFIKHKRYRFDREDGWLKRFYPIDYDGHPVTNEAAFDVMIKRKL